MPGSWGFLAVRDSRGSVVVDLRVYKTRGVETSLSRLLARIDVEYNL
jgi:hypothetical protein